MDILNNNYPVFVLNNNEEFKKIQQKLFSIDITWCTKEKVVFTENEDKFPIHIFIDKNDKKFFYRTKDKLYLDSVRSTIIDNYDPENYNDITDSVYTLLEFDRVFKLKPNYSPKKRLLESLDIKKYRFKTREEFEQEYGWGWEKKVSWNPDGLMDFLFGTDFKEPIPDDDYWEVDIPNKNYGVDNDFNYWEINPKMIKEKNDKPNYTPKKKRVMENLLLEDEFKYLPFRIWCDTLEKAIDCEEFLHKNRYYYPMEPKKYLLRNGNMGVDWDFTCFTFTDLNIHNRTFDGYDYKLTELGKEELVFPRDKGKIKNVLKFGKILPNYRPKKKKLYEKNNSFSDANEITILIRNVDELILLDNNIKPLGYVIRNGFFDLMKHAESPINVFIDLNSGNITQTTLNDFRRKNFSSSFMLDGVWERELTIEELPYIIRILKAGRIIDEKPNYKPKKINKLDEGIDYESLKRMSKYPPTLTPEDQRRLFKVGDTVIIRPDAYDYFRDIDEEHMNFDLGQEVIITQINTLNDVYIPRANGSYSSIINTSTVNSDDLLITVKSPRHSNTYYWYYRCLYIPIKKPDYSPRKINKFDET